MTDFRQSALEWAKSFPVLPIKYRDKIPLTEHGLKDASQLTLTIIEWWNRWPTANIAIVCNGLLVMDLDTKESKPSLIAKYGELPKTRVHLTGGGGEHWLFRVPTDLNIRPGARKYGIPGLDIRANDSYILVPPSITTGEYKVIDDSPIASAPEWLIELSKTPTPTRIKDYESNSMNIPTGQRNYTLASLAGTMRRRGVNNEAITAALIETNNRQCNPPLPENEVLRIALSISRYPPEPPDNGHENNDGFSNTTIYNLTDAGNAEAIIAEWLATVHFIYEWRTWIIYKGGRWVRDQSGIMQLRAIKTMRRLYHDADNIKDLKAREKAASWYINSESDKRINAALSLAECLPGVSIKAEDLDNKPWYLNVKNGTIDLQSGELMQAKPEDLLTQQIEIDYNPEAKSEEWEQFINTIFENNQDLINHVRRGIGYTLNGTQLERVLFFLWGLGMNGKSQLMGALRRVLSPYALECKPELFMEKRFAAGGPDEGQAALKGIRLLTATEIKRNQTLDVSLIKRMTGGEPIWHERKFQRGYSFLPTHTLWLSGNHEPQIKDTTESIWDRLHKIPFEVRIPLDRVIKGYGDILAEKYPEAILNWCIAGAKDWKSQGLNPPESVLIANNEYRARQDLLHDFIEEYIIKDHDFNITIQDMYKAYESYCKDNDIEAIGKRTFNEAMREHGFKDKRGHANKPVWEGVTLVTLVTENKESFLACAREKKLSDKSVTQVTLSFENQKESNPDNPKCPVCGSIEKVYDRSGNEVCAGCHPELCGME